MPSLTSCLVRLGSMAVVFVAVWSSVAQADDASKPNVVIVLADDLGYSDLGCYGSEIETPRIDALAANGLRFTQFYNTARCWPTRGALLTGYYAQSIRRDQVPHVNSGGKGQRPEWAKLLPSMLTSAGYRSYHAGKWHVDGMPIEQGFDRSYYLKDQGRYFNPRKHYLDDQPLPAVKPDSGYYGTQAVVQHSIEMLQQHAAEHARQPFFLYLAFAAPHFPLQALPDDIARYRDRYTVGWEQIRAERWQRMQQLQLVSAPLSDVERDVGPPYDFPEAFQILGPDEINRPLTWDSLTASQQEFQATKMAIHAAMIDRIDRELGRVLDQLQKMNAWENTWLCFLSDNGASAEIMVRDDGHDPQASPGSAGTYLCLGPGWSTVSNSPFRRHKTWVHEGGISTPLVVHWPAGIRARNELRQTPGHVIDLVPTVRELAGLDPDACADNAPKRPGRSLVPVFAVDQPPRPEPLWWLHEENRALRLGDWKITAAKGEPWSLYNLATDRSETHDLARDEPERLQQLSDLWEARWEEYQRVAREE
ncbi:MAG: arylsulfatase [Planctomycetaceae bacterium]